MSHQGNSPNPAPQRYWLGMPVSWDWKNWNKGFWNREDPRLFPPKRVGIGWTINFYVVGRSLRILK
jgi:uncharacterized membrane protein